MQHLQPRNMNANCQCKLKYQVRQCANCQKAESCNTEGERFKPRDTAMLDAVSHSSYLSFSHADKLEEKKDWPKHKRRCETQFSQSAIAEETNWTRNGRQARAAFRIDSAEVVPMSELRVAATDATHRLYDQDVKVIVADFDRQFADTVASGVALSLNHRISMVLHSVYFHNGISAMQFHKNWYYEDDRRTDYSQQWRPPAGDWLGFLKDTVAEGRGWDRTDVHF
ncbi:hypothetical protein FB451DRAFT_1161293 [Mycena latifolia]|nr:hypothetical protein FB451DRAFT_1161293 [Mycena latifolia]